LKEVFIIKKYFKKTKIPNTQSIERSFYIFLAENIFEKPKYPSINARKSCSLPSSCDHSQDSQKPATGWCGDRRTIMHETSASRDSNIFQLILLV
jgi:hypothetical protein